MKPIWVLVAERSRARLFELETATGPLQELQDWTDTRARQRAGEFETTERPGRSFDSWGEQRHAMEPPSDPMDKLAERFAADLVAHLETEYDRHRFATLVLVAAPAMLGVLRAQMPDKLSQIATEVPKSLVKRSPATIRAHLPTPPVYPEPSPPS